MEHHLFYNPEQEKYAVAFGDDESDAFDRAARMMSLNNLNELEHIERVDNQPAQDPKTGVYEEDPR